LRDLQYPGTPIGQKGPNAPFELGEIGTNLSGVKSNASAGRGLENDVIGPDSSVAQAVTLLAGRSSSSSTI
jgi:hypothetical protein